MPGGMYKRAKPGVRKKTGSTLMNKKLRGAITDKEMAMMTARKKKKRVR